MWEAMRRSIAVHFESKAFPSCIFPLRLIRFSEAVGVSYSECRTFLPQGHDSGRIDILGHQSQYGCHFRARVLLHPWMGPPWGVSYSSMRYIICRPELFWGA